MSTPEKVKSKSVSLPPHVWQKVENKALKNFNGNRSAYIAHLVEKDLKDLHEESLTEEDYIRAIYVEAFRQGQDNAQFHIVPIDAYQHLLVPNELSEDDKMQAVRYAATKVGGIPEGCSIIKATEPREYRVIKEQETKRMKVITRPPFPLHTKGT